MQQQSSFEKTLWNKTTRTNARQEGAQWRLPPQPANRPGMGGVLAPHKQLELPLHRPRLVIPSPEGGLSTDGAAGTASVCSPAACQSCGLTASAVPVPWVTCKARPPSRPQAVPQVTPPCCSVPNALSPQLTGCTPMLCTNPHAVHKPPCQHAQPPARCTLPDLHPPRTPNAPARSRNHYV